MGQGVAYIAAVGCWNLIWLAGKFWGLDAQHMGVMAGAGAEAGGTRWDGSRDEGCLEMIHQLIRTCTCAD